MYCNQNSLIYVAGNNATEFLEIHTIETYLLGYKNCDEHNYVDTEGK